VIGLDGVPNTLLRDMAARGVMPFFKSLIDSGSLHSMKASLPEISSVSWTDFMTGANSGRHGIFGFTDLKENTYDMRFPNFNNVSAETLWDRLAQKKKKSIVINQPSTYPARKINGILISGFVAIELSKAVFPITYKDTLQKIGYEIDIDTFKSREDHEFLWKSLKSTLEGRKKAFQLLWEEDWDYFEFIITGTDRLQHFLWNAYEDTNHHYHQNFLDYYSSIDDLVREIATAYEKITGGYEGLYLLSDHGFTGIEQEVYLNTWLKQEGYLSFETQEPQNLGDISEKARAFTMDPNRIYVHTKDRYPKGSVDHAEKNALKKELQQKLQMLEYNGKKIVKKVFDAQEVYSGPQSGKGPDLIVVGEHGFDMKGSIKKKEIFGRTNLEGMHTWDNAFFWSLKDQGTDLVIKKKKKIILGHFE